MPRLAGTLLAALLLTACSQSAGPSTATPATTEAGVTTVPVPATTITLPTRPPLCEEQWGPTEVGVVTDPELGEISGVAVSRSNPGVLWVHNDSGDEAAIAALALDGTMLGRITLPDLTARDWEDMAVGPGPSGGDYLYLADIGDNTAGHPSVFIHRIAEPAPGAGELRGGETLEVEYPDGPMEAESLLVDPESGDMVILGKAFSGRTPVFEIPSTVAWDATTTARYVDTIPLGSFALATGADADSGRIVVRTYDEVFLWTRRAGDSIATTLVGRGCRIASVRDQQGEAVALQPGTEAFFTLSEGFDQPILRFGPRKDS